MGFCSINTRLNGKVAVVTGGSAGIGYVVAEKLATQGARVIIASRNETKLRQARDKIKEATGNNNVDYRTLDLGSFKSVRQFANETLNNEDRLDILINNAGAVGLPDRLTDDGLNLTMQVNYFGVFLLTYLLVPMLKSSSPSRIIIGTALSMYVGEINFDHWNDIGRYNLLTSLGNSKLADSLFMVELSDRLKGTGVTVNSFDPFAVRDTDVLSNLDSFISDVSKFFINIVGRQKEDVGDEIAYLASSPELGNVSGKNFKFCHEWMNHWLVNNKQLRKELWEISKRLVKISTKEDWELN